MWLSGDRPNAGIAPMHSLDPLALINRDVGGRSARNVATASAGMSVAARNIGTPSVRKA